MWLFGWKKKFLFECTTGYPPLQVLLSWKVGLFWYRMGIQPEFYFHDQMSLCHNVNFPLGIVMSCIIILLSNGGLPGHQTSHLRQYNVNPNKLIIMSLHLNCDWPFSLCFLLLYSVFTIRLCNWEQESTRNAPFR